MHKTMRLLFKGPVLAGEDDAAAENIEDAEIEMRNLFGISEDAEDNSSAAEAGDTATDSDVTDTGASSDAATQSSETNTENQKPAQQPDDVEKNKKSEVKAEINFNPEDKFSKQNQAFAQMRLQNKELSDLLIKIASATGQAPKNVEDAKEILKSSLTHVIAKNKNIPEEVLNEMDRDKQELAQLRQEQTKQKALAGFQAVKDVHGLSREEVNSFADKLIEKGINPFEKEVDLVKEYRNLYYEEIIAKAREQGVQEERARSMKAQQNSTTPGNKKGVLENTGNTSAPVKSVKDLDKLLDSLKD